MTAASLPDCAESNVAWERGSVGHKTSGDFNIFLSFRVVNITSKKITVFWNVMPYSLVDKYHILEEPVTSIFRVES
jgi:hypothetical protein